MRLRTFTEVLGKEALSQASKWKCFVFLAAISYQNGNLIEAEKYFIKAVREDSKTLPAEGVFQLHMINFYKSVRKRIL